MVGGTVRQLSLPSEFPIGSRLSKIRRALFVHGADLDGSVGELELSFDNGQVFSVGVAGNGESLAIEPHAWAEHFPEPVSPENQEFLWSSGKWEILDLGASLWSYRQYVGQKLIDVVPSNNSVLLMFDGLRIAINVVADDLRVEFQRE